MPLYNSRIMLAAVLVISLVVCTLSASVSSPRHSFTTRSGEERNFLLHVPDVYNAKTVIPLILAFHGKQQSPETFEEESSFSDPAFNDEAIVAYPQGVKEQWNGDPEAPPLSELNDIAMVNDLLDHLEASYSIDKSRIYAFGFSNGGGLTDLLACNTKVSSRIAAFGATSFAVYRDESLKEPLFGRCPSRDAPIPFLEFHGTADPVIHYDGKDTPDGQTYPLPDRMGEWAQRNRCSTDDKNTTTQLHDGHVQKYTWNCGGYEDVVIHYRIAGFGHGFPTTTPTDNDFQRYGPTYFNATPIVMDFFRRWSLPTAEVQPVRDEL